MGLKAAQNLFQFSSESSMPPHAFDIDSSNAVGRSRPKYKDDVKSFIKLTIWCVFIISLCIFLYSIVQSREPNKEAAEARDKQAAKPNKDDHGSGPTLFYYTEFDNCTGAKVEVHPSVMVGRRRRKVHPSDSKCAAFHIDVANYPSPLYGDVSCE